MAFALWAVAAWLESFVIGTRAWLQSLACWLRSHDAPGGWCRRCGLLVKGENDD